MASEMFSNSEIAQVVVSTSRKVNTGRKLAIFNRARGREGWVIILDPLTRGERSQHITDAQAARFFEKQGYGSRAVFSFTWEDFKTENNNR
jgi:hypothetical protein